jgi:bifunctional DNase/RNase
MIFKNEKEDITLPVWLDPVDASILLADNQPQVRSQGAHRASLKIFKALGIDLKSVYFDEIQGSTQYATVTASHGKTLSTIQVRAAEIMSLAVNAGCVFYTNQTIIEKSRQLNVEWLLQMDMGAGALDRKYEGVH